MADREQPYDPYIPSQSKPGHDGSAAGNQRTAALQAVGHSLLVSALFRITGEQKRESWTKSSLRWKAFILMAVFY